MVEMLTSQCGVCMASVVVAATYFTHLMIGNSVWVGVSCSKGISIEWKRLGTRAPGFLVVSEHVFIFGERHSNACVCMGREV